MRMKLVSVSLSLLLCSALAVAADEALTFTTNENAMTVSLRIEPARPAGGTLTLRSYDNGTSAVKKLDAAGVSALRRLVIAPGSYDLLIELEGHRAAWRKVDARTATTLALGAIAVPKAPVIRGTVLREDGGKPVAGARVTWEPSGSATTDAAGAFALPMVAEWPSHLVVSAPGLGARVIPIEAAEADVNLPPVSLAKAGSVKVKVVRGADDQPLDVLLGVRQDEQEPIWIARKRLQAKQSQTLFTGVDRGIYTVLVRGREPFEQMTAKVVLGTGDTRTAELPIRIAVVSGKITLAGKPLAGVNVHLVHRQQGWPAMATTDDKGEIHSVIWEQGLFFYDLQTAAGRAPVAGQLTLKGSPLISFAVDIPDRSIRGRVVDASGAPVANASVLLRTARPGGGAATIRAVTNEEGGYDFNGIHPGKQLVRINANGFLRPDPIAFEMAEQDVVHDADVVVRPGFSRPLRLTHAGGAPAISATIFCVSNGIIRSRTSTDAEGRADVATPEEGEAVLYVIPREGSLLVQRLVSMNDDTGGTLRLTVPPGSASLRIATKTAEGDQMPSLSLLMRYNGELLPPDVAHLFESQQGQALTTDESGEARLAHIPPGVYEFWPYRADSEAEAILASASTMAAPIIVNVVTGENEAVVRFKKRR